MIKVEVLEKAIAAHAGWKARLRSAANTGKFDAPAVTVQSDNLCEFGKWLYGSEISAAEKQSATYSTVKRLHAEFHQEAAKVVDWMTSGNKEAADKSVGMGGNYAKASAQLTEAMVKWRESLR